MYSTDVTSDVRSDVRSMLGLMLPLGDFKNAQNTDKQGVFQIYMLGLGWFAIVPIETPRPKAKIGF